jgi:hypothetical protein
MSLENWSSPDQVLSSDACLDGFGAKSSNQFFHAIFPSFIKENQLHINCLEILAIVIATKIWGHKIKGKQILIFCDNEASVYVINSGSTKDTCMQNCLRELCYIEAIYQFEIKAEYFVGEENRLADYLSRWHIYNRYQNRFVSRVEVQNYEEIQGPDSCYHFLNNWSFIFIKLDVLRLQSKNSAKHAYAESTNKNIRTQLEAYFMFCIYF